MSIISNLIGAVTGRERIEKSVKIYAPGERDAKSVICHRCEKELGPDHNDDVCMKRGLSRRGFFFTGLFAAPAVALAARLEGIPIPEARIQVIARAGDMFEVETLNPFSIAWEDAKNYANEAFRADDGLLQGGGLLQFHGQDVSRPDKWLRVHRGLKEMNVLGVVDTTTGKPVKYRIVRNDEAEKRVSAAYDRIKRAREARELAGFSSRASLIDGSQGLTLPSQVQVPVDTANPARKEHLRSKAVTAGGDFLIDYHAGETRGSDRVRWRRAEVESMLAFPALRSTEKHDGRPVEFNGSLHDAIAAVNQHYPEHSKVLKAAIMGCNPEYRRRVAPVRTVESAQAQADQYGTELQQAAWDEEQLVKEELRKKEHAEMVARIRERGDHIGGESALAAFFGWNSPLGNMDYSHYEAQRVAHRAKQKEESRIYRERKAKGLPAILA